MPLFGKPKASNPFGDGSVFGSEPAQPADPGGLKPGVAQTGINGLNRAQPGQGSKFQADNAQVWQTPSFGEVNNQGLVGQFSDPNNRAQVTDNSQNWMNQFPGAMPNIATEPGFGAYFDQAKSRAAESINQAMAAKGAYGSSAANDQTSRAFADLEAQRALKEADYNLQRLGEQRAWQGLGGQFAGQADSHSLAKAGNEKDWVGLLSKLGVDASRLGLDRTNAGQDAALGAENADRTRGQDFFNNQLASNDRIADLIKSIMGGAIDNDAALAQDASSAGIAEGNQGAANERTNTQDTTGYVKDALSLYNQYKQ